MLSWCFFFQDKSCTPSTRTQTIVNLLCPQASHLQRFTTDPPDHHYFGHHPRLPPSSLAASLCQCAVQVHPTKDPSFLAYHDRGDVGIMDFPLAMVLLVDLDVRERIVISFFLCGFHVKWLLYVFSYVPSGKRFLEKKRWWRWRAATQRNIAAYMIID